MEVAINRKALLIALLLALIPSTLLQAQQSGGKPPRYNPATVVTVTGTVENVTQQATSGRWSGTHLSLKTDDGIIDVHLGPTQFLTDQGLTVTAGQKIEVTGSKIKYENTDALIARTVKVGEKTFELRDEQGYPKWSRNRRN
jgi:hypothetical protein